MEFYDFNRIENDPRYKTYKTRFWRVLIGAMKIIIPFGFAAYLFIVTDSLFVLFFVLFFGSFLIYLFVRYLACAKQVLQISHGADVFYFGEKNNMQFYDQNNIKKITVYQPGGGPGKSLHDFYAYEIIFKNGTLLKFSNMLMSEKNFLENFQSVEVRYGGDKSPFWRL